MQLIDVEQAAKMLLMHPVTVRNKARRGEIPAYKLGGWKFDPVELEKHIKKGTSPAWQDAGQENLACQKVSQHCKSAVKSGITHSLRQTVSEYEKVLGLKTKQKQKS
jgi:hypothetical protein